MNILHSTTDPTLLARLKEMLRSSARADIAVGYFFIGGFGAVSDDLARLNKVRILVGRTDRQVLEEVAVGLQQQQALRVRLDADALVRRRERSQIAQETVARVAQGVAVLPQEQDIAVCAEKLPALICRPVGAQFMGDELIALFEFEHQGDDIRITSEKHYQLVPPEAVTEQDLHIYRQRLADRN